MPIESNSIANIREIISLEYITKTRTACLDPYTNGCKATSIKLALVGSWLEMPIEKF